MYNLVSFRQKSYKVKFKKDVNVCFSLDCERTYNREAGSCGMRTYAYRSLNVHKGNYIISKYVLDFIKKQNKEGIEKKILFKIIEEYKPFTEFDRKTNFANFREEAAPKPLTRQEWKELDLFNVLPIFW